MTRGPDPSDSRAVLVQRTDRGHALLADALQVVAGIETGYAQHLDAERLAALKELLADLLTYSDPTGALGAG